MNFDAAVAEVQMVLGFRKDQDTNIRTAIKNAQAALERKPTLPWFLRKFDDENLTLLEGNSSVALPSGFLLEYDDSGMWLKDSDGAYHRVRKRSVGEMTAKKLSGLPKYYYITDADIVFDALADADYTVRWTYYAADTVLSGGSDENLWLKHAPYMLIGWAGRELARALRDASALQIFSDMLSRATLSVIHKGVALEVEGETLVMGGDD